MDSHGIRGRDRGSHRRTHGRRCFPASVSQRYRPRVTDSGLTSHEGQEHLKYVEKRQDGNNPGDSSSSCANVASNSIRQNPVDSLADKETTRHMKPDISYESSPIKGPETPLQNSFYASRPLPDHIDRHKSQGRGFYQARSGSWRSSPPASQHHRPHASDPVSSSHGGPEHLNSGENRRDGNSPSEPSSCVSVESNQIKNKPADSLAEKGTIRHMGSNMSSGPSPIKEPETSALNLYFASEPLLDHVDCHEGRGFDRRRITGSGSSAHERREKWISIDKHHDANSPGEPSSCASVKNYQIRENPTDSLTDHGRMNHLRRDRTSGPSSIRSPETSSTPSNSSSDSQPFLGNTNRHGFCATRGRGRGWQSSTRVQRDPHGFTDPELSSHGVQERVNIGIQCQDVSNPNEPSSCVSVDSNLIWRNPSADLMIGNAPIKGPGTPGSDGRSDNSEQAFNICLIKKTKFISLQPSLLDKNREKRKESQTMERKNWRELRKGMILLKGYLSLSDQMKIVKQCYDLGSGTGGFYQPSYREGGELKLKMMCLGKNWDPETCSYGDNRPSDGAKPPIIPTEFYQLVQRAVKDSHSFIEENHGVETAEKQLPWLTPDICIVNFYSSTGRLGLHQDRDESESSLRLRLPVVSFSIGDTAEFLYGDQRDVDEATMVKLESGDVLIFGGDSRRVFHGVKAIEPDTAPKSLGSESNLRPGRLNLTFRQY